MPWYHLRRNMTWRLEEYIRERAATLTTFQQIALDTCQDRKTINGILFDAVRELEDDSKKDLPRVLGIDEIYFGKKAYTILVDIESEKRLTYSMAVRRNRSGRDSRRLVTALRSSTSPRISHKATVQRPLRLPRNKTKSTRRNLLLLT